MSAKKLLMAFFISLQVLTVPVLADQAIKVNVVTWNAKEVFSESNVQQRKNDFKNLGVDLQPDILLLQEITSLEVLNKMKKEFGLDNYYSACSDFTKNDNNTHASFEVGILSKYPISDVIEFDPSPGDNKPQYTQTERKLSTNIVTTTGLPDRGFLRIKISDLKLIVNIVHLKSSRGQQNAQDYKENTPKREFVSAAVAESVSKDKIDFPDYTIIVAGDFNIGHSDKNKNGIKLNEDCYTGASCGTKDRYDETHALLSEGLVNGLKMTNLVKNITTSTFPEFPGSPIDNIYVTGVDKNFLPAQKAKTYNSDHTTVYTSFIYNFNVNPFVSFTPLHFNNFYPSEARGAALRSWLKSNTYDGKFHDLGYDGARQSLYNYVSKNDDGKVYCVYTGFALKANNTNNLDPINTEHSIPQSWFNENKPMKSDLHHLFPTHKDVNSSRGSFPFNEVPDQQTNTWFGTQTGNYFKGSNIPTTNINSFSELLKNKSFEPKENHKGDLARAIFYFYTMYPNQAGNISKIITGGNLDILRQWHKNDPVDGWETRRNNRIEEKQGNRNPYIDFPELLEKAWF